MNPIVPRIMAALLSGLCLFVPSCDDDDDWENTGAPCNSAADCYPGIDQEEIAGEVVCMDLVPGGYCTHTCSSDADCCAYEGECQHEDQLDQVCAPFESADEYYCFISCDGQEDGNAYCQKWGHSDFNCRSTGGGSDNEKVCVP